MRNEFWLFLVNVFHNWQALLAGGVLALGIMVYEHWKNRTIRWKVLLVVMAIALFLSCFLAWHDEHHNSEILISEKRDLMIQKNTLQAKLDAKQDELDRMGRTQEQQRERRKATRQIVAKDLAAGTTVSELLFRHDLADDVVARRVQKWMNDTEKHLSDNLGNDYVIRFRNPAGIAGVLPGDRNFASDAKRQLWWPIYYRSVRLTQFLEELKE